MISRAEIQDRAREWGLTDEVVEKDYVLGWLLWGIGQEVRLSDHWVFKGGTCLKKCYLETYRFSEDLDFTVREGGPLTPEVLIPLLTEMLDTIEQESGIELTTRAPVVRLRPGGRSAEGRIYYRGPRRTPGEARVKLDVTHDEIVVDAPVHRPIVHSYDDRLPEPATVPCYSFDEVFAEKLRALGQRARPRDLYDVVNLHRRLGDTDAPTRVNEILTAKCEYKGIEIPSPASVLDGNRGIELASDWEAMLAHQLPSLPPLQDFIDALDGVFAWLAGGLTAALPATPLLNVAVDTSYVAPPTLAHWGGSPIEQIRFAGANHLLVELRYQDTVRLIEPYSLRRSQAGDLLLYAVRARDGAVRSYRVDRIQGARPTDQTFRPRYAIEMSSAPRIRRRH